jgi:hypothetical protein
MICLACVRSLAGIQTAKICRCRINTQHTRHKGIRPSRFHLGVVRPSKLHHYNRFVRMGCFPLGQPFPHPSQTMTPGSSLRATGIPDVSQWAEERGHDDPFIKSFHDSAGFAASASQICIVAASIPCATTWSTFWVITAPSDLPSNANTSAPYFSAAYFFASANCAW